MKPTTRDLWSKTIKVMKSAKTLEQNKSARKYMELAIPHLMKSNNHPMTRSQEVDMIMFFGTGILIALSIVCFLARLLVAII